MCDDPSYHLEVFADVSPKDCSPFASLISCVAACKSAFAEDNAMVTNA